MDLTQRKIFSLTQWKELAAKDEAPKDCLVLVSADLEETKQLDEDSNVFRFVSFWTDVVLQRVLLKIESV